MIMKKYLKSIKNIIELSPALAVTMTALLGFQLTTPTLDDVVWPEKPEIRVEAKGKEDKQENKDDTQKKTSAVGNYKDGIFSGIGIGYGGPMTVRVSVDGGQITTVEVLDNNETENFLNLAKRGIIDAILDRQTWEVDSVSGATYSSRGIKEGVCNAITGQVSTSTTPEKAGPQGAPPANSSFKLGEWADGSYEGTSHGFGGPIKVRVVIKKGKIKSIKVLSHSGETPSYFNKAKSVIKRILNAQNPNVDTVSGATYSSGGIREAVKNALKKAGRTKTKKGVKKKTRSDKTNKNTNPDPEVKIPNGIPADGTYTGTAICRQDGRFNYSVTVTATYKKGKIIDLSMTTTDTGSNKQYIDRAWNTMKTNLLSHANGDVDVVTSATYTSNAIKTAYKLAYKAAVEANGGSLNRSSESQQETTPVKADDPPEGQESEGKDDMSGSHNGEAELSGTPADGEYDVTVLVNSYDAKNSNNNGWFSNYHLSGTVTFSDGKLVSITKIVVGEDADEYEAEDDEYYTSMAAEKMVTSLIEKQSNDVDAVTGATCSSKGIVALYEEAFRQAVKAYKEPDSDQKETGEENKPGSATSDKEESKPEPSAPEKEESKPEPSAPEKEESKPEPSAPEKEENKPEPSIPDKEDTSEKTEKDKEEPLSSEEEKPQVSEENSSEETEQKDGGTGA